MRGCIVERKTATGVSRFAIKYRVPSGEQVFRTIGSSRREAENALAIVLGRMAKEGRGFRKPKDAMFSIFVERFLKDNAYRYKPSTIATYRGVAKRHLIPYWGRSKMRDSVTVESVAAYIGHSLQQGMTIGTLNHSLDVLGAICSWAVKVDVMASSPVRQVVRPRDPSDGFERQVLSPEQMHKVIQMTPKGWQRNLVTIAAHTALRAGEIAALKSSSVDFSSSDLAISATTWGSRLQSTTKTGKSRRVAMSQAVQAAIRSQLTARMPNPSDLLFCTTTGAPLNMARVGNDVLKPALKRAGIALPDRQDGWMVFRHSTISYWCASGMPPAAIASISGHRVETLYRHYLHGVTEDRKQAAVLMDALESGRPDVTCRGSRGTSARCS